MEHLVSKFVSVWGIDPVGMSQNRTKTKKQKLLLLLDPDIMNAYLVNFAHQLDVTICPGLLLLFCQETSTETMKVY